MDRKTAITEGYEKWYQKEFSGGNIIKFAVRVNIGFMFAYWCELMPLEFRKEYDWQCDNENDLFNLLVSRIKQAEEDK